MSHAPGTEHVTVVIPTHHRPELVRRAIDAVVAQDHPGQIDVLVVHDRSEPDTTLDLVTDNRTVRAIPNAQDPGLAGGRNTGIDAAQGDFLAQCDDDDAWLRTKLTAQLDAFRRQPDAAIAVTGVIVEYGEHHTPREPPATIELADLFRDRIFAAHPSSYLMPLDLVRDQVGHIDAKLPGGYGEDWDWIIRCARVGSVAVVTSPLVRLTWGATSFFQDRWEMIIEALEHLEDKHPEFRQDRRARGYLGARKAFARAAMGDKAGARETAVAAIRDDWRQKQAYAALAVGSGALTAERAMALAHRAGRGI